MSRPRKPDTSSEKAASSKKDRLIPKKPSTQDITTTAVASPGEDSEGLPPLDPEFEGATSSAQNQNVTQVKPDRPSSQPPQPVKERQAGKHTLGQAGSRCNCLNCNCKCCEEVGLRKTSTLEKRGREADDLLQVSVSLRSSSSVSPHGIGHNQKSPRYGDANEGEDDKTQETRTQPNEPNSGLLPRSQGKQIKPGKNETKERRPPRVSSAPSLANPKFGTGHGAEKKVSLNPNDPSPDCISKTNISYFMGKSSSRDEGDQAEAAESDEEIAVNIRVVFTNSHGSATSLTSVVRTHLGEKVERPSPKKRADRQMTKEHPPDTPAVKETPATSVLEDRKPVKPDVSEQPPEHAGVTEQAPGELSLKDIVPLASSGEQTRGQRRASKAETKPPKESMPPASSEQTRGQRRQSKAETKPLEESMPPASSQQTRGKRRESKAETEPPKESMPPASSEQTHVPTGESKAEKKSSKESMPPASSEQTRGQRRESKAETKHPKGSMPVASSEQIRDAVKEPKSYDLSTMLLHAEPKLAIEDERSRCEGLIERTDAPAIPWDKVDISLATTEHSRDSETGISVRVSQQRFGEVVAPPAETARSSESLVIADIEGLTRMLMGKVIQLKATHEKLKLAKTSAKDALQKSGLERPDAGGRTLGDIQGARQESAQDLAREGKGQKISGTKEAPGKQADSASKNKHKERIEEYVYSSPEILESIEDSCHSPLLKGETSDSHGKTKAGPPSQTPIGKATDASQKKKAPKKQAGSDSRNKHKEDIEDYVYSSPELLESMEDSCYSPTLQKETNYAPGKTKARRTSQALAGKTTDESQKQGSQAAPASQTSKKDSSGKNNQSGSGTTSSTKDGNIKPGAPKLQKKKA